MKVITHEIGLGRYLGTLRRVALVACAVSLVSSCAISKEKAVSAVKSGDVQTVAKYLDQDTGNIADTVELGYSYAHLAVQFDQVEVLKLLIAKGIDVNKANSTGFTPLHLAAVLNMPKTAKALIDAGVDVNQTNGRDKNKAAIHYAAINESLDIAPILLDNGVDINVLCGIKATPVIWAAFAGTLESVKFFVERNADMTVVDSNGDTALTSAKMSRKNDIYQYLLSIGITK